MIDDMESDFCDRLPGQHLGRLSLELQAREAAEWQQKIAELECRLKVTEDTICELLGTRSQAAGESPGISPEVPQAHGLTTPATPSSAVGASELGAGDTVPPEVGKRYVCRNGEVTDAMTDDGGPAYPFMTSVNGIHRSWRGDGSHDESNVSDFDLIDEYHKPSPPAESPDDWVMITDPDHIVRACDRLSSDSLNWRCPIDSVGNPIRDYPALTFCCRRKDLPVVPSEKWTSEVRPVEDYEVKYPDKPRMRQVTLREYKKGRQSYWTTATDIEPATGRTCVTEVPE